MAVKQRQGVLLTEAFVSAIVVGFSLTVSFYGDRWLPPWHDEAVIARLAYNISVGNGFVNDQLGGLLPSAERKTFWQMPFYPFLLSLWGRLFFFDLNGLRLFSRLLSTKSLVLLWFLSVRLGLTPGFAALAVLWCSCDISFQLMGNFVRPEALSCFLFLLMLLGATRVINRSTRLLLAMGIIGGAGLLTHPIALLPLMAYTVGLCRDRRSPLPLLMLLPSSLFLIGWLVWALTDWNAFVVQMQAHGFHKSYSLTDYIGFATGSSFWALSHYLGVPVNAFPWLAVIVLWFLLVYRYGNPMPRWLLWFSAVTYLVTCVGAEAWYPPIFIPVGYLLLALFLQLLAQRTRRRLIVAMAGLGWWVFQSVIVVRHCIAVPSLTHETDRFFADVDHFLPPHSTVILGNFVPDPSFHFQRHRQDLVLYQMMPPPMVSRRALERLRPQLKFSLTNSFTKDIDLLQGRLVGSWRFRFGGLSHPARAAAPPQVYLFRLDQTLEQDPRSDSLPPMSSSMPSKEESKP